MKENLTFAMFVECTIVFKKNGPTCGGYKMLSLYERFTRVNSMRWKTMQC